MNNRTIHNSFHTALSRGSGRIEDACGESPAASLERGLSLQAFQIIRSLFDHYSFVGDRKRPNIDLGVSWGHLGWLLWGLGVVLGGLWGVLGGPGVLLEGFWDVLGRSWGGLGEVWGRPWGGLGRSWGDLGATFGAVQFSIIF